MDASTETRWMRMQKRDGCVNKTRQHNQCCDAQPLSVSQILLKAWPLLQHQHSAGSLRWPLRRMRPLSALHVRPCPV
eukprot:365531-Chlamydomonas_euryale.AAC.8